MDSFYNSTLLFILIFFAAALFVASQISTTIPTPPHAIFYVNNSTNEFFPEPCATDALLYPRGQSVRQTTYLEIVEIDATLMPECTVALTQQGRSWLGVLMEKVNLLTPPEPRWDSDGHWRY